MSLQMDKLDVFESFRANDFRVLNARTVQVRGQSHLSIVISDELLLPRLDILFCSNYHPVCHPV